MSKTQKYVKENEDKLKETIRELKADKKKLEKRVKELERKVKSLTEIRPKKDKIKRIDKPVNLKDLEGNEFKKEFVRRFRPKGETK